MMEHSFAICTDNEGYEASLELRKLYEVLPDDDAQRHAQIRVVDESGEDYLYPAASFTPVSLPASVVAQLVRAA